MRAWSGRTPEPIPTKERAPELADPHDDLGLLRDDDDAAPVNADENALISPANDDDPAPAL